MKRNKSLIVIAILFLTIGFAAVSTTLILNGTINIGTNQEDFDVYFSNAIIDGIEDLSLISEDKKTINFETIDLSKVGDKSILEYEVINASTQYDANVSVTCTPNETDLYKVINTIDKEIIEARTTGNGVVTVELKKNVLEEQKINFTCTITANAVEREISNETALPTDDTYVLEGTYVDSTGKAIPNANLVVYSDTPHYVTTDASGNLLVSNLEKGNHEIYHVNDTLENIKNMSKEQIVAKSVTRAEFTTKDITIVFGNNNTISSNIVKNKEYCLGKVGNTYDFNYTGGEQKISTICAGVYKLETWGASGGSYNSAFRGGYGAYATGLITLEKDEKLFINVGGQGTGNGTHVFRAGGYNGGGDGMVDGDGNSRQGSGGGATHIAKLSGLLSDLEKYKDQIIIVAGGGAGMGENSVYIGQKWSTIISIGEAGGIQGKETNIYNSRSASENIPFYRVGTGGTQTFGGSGYLDKNNTIINDATDGFFGKGASCIYSGGGGGYYGGGCSYYSAGGGSSYVGNPNLIDKVMYCYECAESNEESTRTISVKEVSDKPEVNKAKQGNGYAKITYLGVK